MVVMMFLVRIETGYTHPISQYCVCVAFYIYTKPDQFSHLLYKNHLLFKEADNRGFDAMQSSLISHDNMKMALELDSIFLFSKCEIIQLYKSFKL